MLPKHDLAFVIGDERDAAVVRDDEREPVRAIAHEAIGGAVASADTVGNFAIQRSQYGITVATRVCCNITSLTQIAYGSRVRRQGRSRRTDW